MDRVEVQTTDLYMYRPSGSSDDRPMARIEVKTIVVWTEINVKLEVQTIDLWTGWKSRR